MKYNNQVDPNIVNYYLKYLKNNNLYSKETYQQGIKQLQEGKPNRRQNCKTRQFW